MPIYAIIVTTMSSQPNTLKSYLIGLIQLINLHNMTLPNEISRCIIENAALIKLAYVILIVTMDAPYSHFNEESCASYWQVSK